MEDEIESLYHYGVKGMRWGRRKAVDDAKPPSARKVRDENIKAARRDWATKGDDVTVAFAKYKTLKPGGAAQKKAEAIVMQKQDEYMRTVVLASQRTSGEKWIARVSGAIMGVSIAATVIGNMG